MARRRDKHEERRIAESRINRLVELADAAVHVGRTDRADRYGEIAWRVKMKYQARGTAIDTRICRACHHFLAPGVTARVRLTHGRRCITCLACGVTRRKTLHAE